MEELLKILNEPTYDEPKVFVTTYSLYNQGKQFATPLTGFWVTCEAFKEHSDLIGQSFDKQDPDCSGDHEYMFTDYEDFPEELYSESGMDFDLISEWYGLDEGQREKVEAYLEHYSNSVREALDNIDDYDLVEGTLADYAEERVREMYDIPEYLHGYIDYQRLGEDDSDAIYEHSRTQLLVVRIY